jgi:hypothetical protein
MLHLGRLKNHCQILVLAKKTHVDKRFSLFVQSVGGNEIKFYKKTPGSLTIKLFVLVIDQMVALIDKHPSLLLP